MSQCRRLKADAAMIICLFGGVRVLPGMEQRARRLEDTVNESMRAADGFISYKTYTAHDGEAVGIIRFESQETMHRWAYGDLHLTIQAQAPDIYEFFWIQSADTYREYTWAAGVHTDADLTSIFTD